MMEKNLQRIKIDESDGHLAIYANGVDVSDGRPNEIELSGDFYADSATVGKLAILLNKDRALKKIENYYVNLYDRGVAYYIPKDEAFNEMYREFEEEKEKFRDKIGEYNKRDVDLKAENSTLESKLNTAKDSIAYCMDYEYTGIGSKLPKWRQKLIKLIAGKYGWKKILQGLDTK